MIHNSTPRSMCWGGDHCFAVTHHYRGHLVVLVGHGGLYRPWHWDALRPFNYDQPEKSVAVASSRAPCATTKSALEHAKIAIDELLGTESVGTRC